MNGSNTPKNIGTNIIIGKEESLEELELMSAGPLKIRISTNITKPIKRKKPATKNLSIFPTEYQLPDISCY